MSKDIEKLIKIQGAINKSKYHLFIETDLEETYRWILYIYNPNIENYMSEYNFSILNSYDDSIDYLIDYLKNHDGLTGRYF